MKTEAEQQFLNRSNSSSSSCTSSGSGSSSSSGPAVKNLGGHHGLGHRHGSPAGMGGTGAGAGDGGIGPVLMEMNAGGMGAERKPSDFDANPMGYTPFERRKRSWSELREDVRDIRRRLWSLGSRVPHSFTFRRMIGKTRVYFMSSPPNSRDNSVFAVDVPDECPPFSSSPSEPLSNNKGDVRFPWIQIIASDFQVSLRFDLFKK